MGAIESRRLRFVDGPAARAVLLERYKEQLAGKTMRERAAWELGFDYGVDDRDHNLRHLETEPTS